MLIRIEPGRGVEMNPAAIRRAVGSFALALLSLGPSAGCGDRDAAGAAQLTASDFAAVVVDLRTSADTLRSAADWERQKQQILERHGVTERQLDAFVRRRGGDVSQMADLWESIRVRLRESAADSVGA